MKRSWRVYLFSFLSLFLSLSYFSTLFVTVLLADFKKAAPEDKLSLFNSLLKGYQEEVDNLTKRAKFGENAFLNIYQKLYEAPDPYPVLASVAVSTNAFHLFVMLEKVSMQL